MSSILSRTFTLNKLIKHKQMICNVDGFSMPSKWCKQINMFNWKLDTREIMTDINYNGRKSEKNVLASMQSST
jgi:hypothetical protein